MKYMIVTEGEVTNLKISEGAVKLSEVSYDKYLRNEAVAYKLIACVETYVNDVLKIQGYISLNKVRDELGAKAIPYGYASGWLGTTSISFEVYSVRNADTGSLVDIIVDAKQKED